MVFSASEEWILKFFGLEITGPRVRFSKDIRAESVDDAGGVSVPGTLPFMVSGANRKSVSVDVAQTISVVFACVRIISGSVSQMGLNIYSVKSNGDFRKASSQKDLHRILNVEPCYLFSANSFWECVVSEVLLTGNSYVLIDRKGNSIVGLVPMTKQVQRVENDGKRLTYITNGPDGKGEQKIPQENVLHFTGAVFDGVKGKSVLETGASLASNLALDLDTYLKDYFANGTLQQFIVKREQPFTQEQYENFLRGFQDRYAQGVSGRWAPIVMDSMSDIKPLSFSLRDTQMIEGREFQITDIARAFGVPSFLINQEQKTTSFGSGVGEIGQSFLRYTLMPHIVRFQSELNRKLMPESTNMEIRFDYSGIVKANLKERYESHRIALGGAGMAGWASVNEVRTLEGLPRLPGAEYDKVATSGASVVNPDAVIESDTNKGVDNQSGVNNES